MLPYLLLMAAIVAAWWFETRVVLALTAAAIVAGLTSGALAPIALIWVLALGLPLALQQRVAWQGVGRILCYGIFLVAAVLMGNHLAPGFHNLAVFKDERLSPDSLPFTMYLNFDKGLVGLFVMLYLIRAREKDITANHIFHSLKILAALVIVLMPLALGFHYVHLDLKTPEQSWLWALNNLILVCIAEEGLFRGFVQKGLIAGLANFRFGRIIAVMTAALLFGLAHYRGGISYIAFASIAGLFYGYAFAKTERFAAPVLVHFGLNTIHFFCFSYPALA